MISVFYKKLDLIKEIKLCNIYCMKTASLHNVLLLLLQKRRRQMPLREVSLFRTQDIQMIAFEVVLKIKLLYKFNNK